MKTITMMALLIAVALSVGQAKDTDAQATGSPAITTAVGTAKEHVRALLGQDYEKLKETYPTKVFLMPGHEVLKDKYGFAGPEGRVKGKAMTRAKLIRAMKKANKDRSPPPGPVIDKGLKKVTFKSLKVKPGDYVMEPPQPVETLDGKLHFSIEGGDELIKVAEKNGNVILFQLRQI